MENLWLISQRESKTFTSHLLNWAIYLLECKYADQFILQVFNLRQRGREREGEKTLELLYFTRILLSSFLSISLKSPIRGRKKMIWTRYVYVTPEGHKQTFTKTCRWFYKEVYCRCKGASAQWRVKGIVGWWWGLMLISRMDGGQGPWLWLWGWCRSLAQSADPELSRVYQSEPEHLCCHRQCCSSSVQNIAGIGTASKFEPVLWHCSR